MLLRRQENNLGEEDLSADEADDEGTLLRSTPANVIFKPQSAAAAAGKLRVNGTSEIKDQKPPVIGKFLEKGKASLSRSKSELGEQHKKMISHWSRSKNEISEQNKKLLANIEQKFKLKSKSKKGDSLTKNGSNGSANNHEHDDVNDNDLDGLMTNLGLDVMHAKRRSVTENSNLMMTTSLYSQTPAPSTNNDLEKHLENDYGEFEYIDEGATLTRTLKTNGESIVEHRKSMFSFSDEVFDELEKSGTLKRGDQNIYETYGSWRQKHHQGSAQRYHYNNNNSVTNNTSAKLQALIADQTLLLRHHKRRQQVQQEDLEREEQLQSLLILQQQLAAATKEHLEGSSSSKTSIAFGGGAPLRRCSSLSQTCPDSIQESPPPAALPPAKINGTAAGGSPYSPWLSNSSNSSTSSKYLYRGKFTANNNNVKSPWQLRSNLSSFARRRRGSSTSLHTFSDNDEDQQQQVSSTSGFKKTSPDSISLAGSEESVNHR